MNYETKQEVFEDALRALEEFGEQGSSWEMVYDDLSACYAAALPDDVPVIPKAVAKYINDMKSSGRDIWDAMHYLLRSNNIASIWKIIRKHLPVHGCLASGVLKKLGR